MPAGGARHAQHDSQGCQETNVAAQGSRLSITIRPHKDAVSAGCYPGFVLGQNHLEPLSWLLQPRWLGRTLVWNSPVPRLQTDLDLAVWCIMRTDPRLQLAFGSVHHDQPAAMNGGSGSCTGKLQT
jgi:hypothetical protein